MKQNKTLLYVFLALLIIYLLSTLFGGQKSSSFDPQLVQIDTSLVDRVLLYPKSDEFKEIELLLQNGQWTISKEAISVSAKLSNVRALIGMLQNIKAKRIAAKDPAKWAEYEVDESNGSRIKLFSQGSELLDLVSGRFNFNQQTRSAVSYLRKIGDDNVYVIDGFLSMTLGQGFNAYRNNTVLEFNEDDITELNLTSSSGRKVLNKNNGLWMNQSGMTIDSSAMTAYLAKLAKLTSNDFKDGVDINSMAQHHAASIMIKGNNLRAPIQVSLFRNPESNAYLIQSSQNSEALFSSDSVGIFKSLYLDFPI